MLLSSLALSVAISLLFACSSPSSPPENTANEPAHDGVGPAAGAVLEIAVVNYPLASLAERIGGAHVRVQFPAPADVDPAVWSPAADVVAAYQQADLILLNGARYARWINRVTLPASRLVNTSTGFEDRYIAIQNAPTHSHGPEGDHSHGELAFTTWLDPRLALEQAAAIRDALATALPAQTSQFETRFAALRKDMEDVDRLLAAALAPLGATPLLASHPVYQYLARRYGLNLESVHFEPDADPDEKDWQELEEILSRHPARFMLWEDEPTAATKRRLDALGVAIVVFRPCAGTPASGHFMSTMRSNVAAVAAALGTAAAAIKTGG